MSGFKIFGEATKVLNELSQAAASARTEVQKLLDVLEGPAVTDAKSKANAPAPSGPLFWTPWEQANCKKGECPEIMQNNP